MRIFGWVGVRYVKPGTYLSYKGPVVYNTLVQNTLNIRLEDIQIIIIHSKFR